MTSNFSRNLSFISRCHWNVRLAGATISVRLTRPRAFSSLSSSPAMIVLPGAGVVGQQEADARQLQEVVVDRFQLVRQRIDAGDGEREERVVLVGEAQPLRLDAEPEQPGVAVERGWSADTTSWDCCAADRTMSLASPVCRPLPNTRTASPSAVTATTSIGSGNTDPEITKPARSDCCGMRYAQASWPGEVAGLAASRLRGHVSPCAERLSTTLTGGVTTEVTRARRRLSRIHGRWRSALVRGSVPKSILERLAGGADGPSTVMESLRGVPRPERAAKDTVVESGFLDSHWQTTVLPAPPRRKANRDWVNPDWPTARQFAVGVRLLSISFDRGKQGLRSGAADLGAGYIVTAWLG